MRFSRFSKISKNPEKYFWIDRKNIFRKSWKKFRTSRSMQNLLADRMEALSASESHSQTFPEKIINKLHGFEENLLFGFESYNEIGDSTLSGDIHVKPPLWRKSELNEGGFFTWS